jgi:Reverse transcriptase (RNA-dependent DNA polymerase)/Endonuclease-reverse transcriptase
MSLKAFSWNAHSVQSKKSEITKFIENNKINSVLLSETWLNEKSNFNIPQFSCYRCDRPYGGVAILIHDSIAHSFHSQVSLDYAECIFVKIHDAGSEFILASVYCSPSANRSQAHKFFQKILSVPGPLVIAGDFNCKHHLWNNPSFCRKGSDLAKLCTEKRFRIHSPDEPTCFPPVGNPSTIDFVLSRAINGISDPRTINDLSSDHLPISFEVKVNSLPLLTKIANYRKANWKKFRSSVDSSVDRLRAKFPSLNSGEQIDECVSDLTKAISTAMDDAIPLKNPYRFRYSHSKRLEVLIRNRNKFRNLFQKTLNPAFKSATNQLNRLIKQETAALNQFSFEKKLENLSFRDNSLFQFAKSLKSAKKNLPPIKTLDPVRPLAFCNQDKANTLAAGFLSSHETTTKFPSKHERLVKDSVKKIKASKISIPAENEIKAGDVQEIVNNLNIRKASGPDSIPIRVIKKLPTSAIRLLAFIFNAAFRLSYFPLQWKLGKVVAIPKPGKDPTFPTNYRPISLLSNIGKMFERIVLLQLTSFEHREKILIPQQFGFRNEHSTVQQILRITEKTAMNFNQNRSTGLVLLDIEKAFDSVWHDGLVHKLAKLNYPLHLTKLIISFLNERKAFVSVGKESSAQFSIPAGVPQGSLLSPHLFNIFINDIPIPPFCHLAIYADDTALYCEVPWKNLKLLCKTLEKGLESIANFFQQWKIKINETKTEAIVFTHSGVMKKRMLALSPIFNKSPLVWKDSVKYLGVQLDQKLNFKEHIDSSIKKANKAISVLYCMLKKNSATTIESKATLYKSYIRPIFTYACPVLANCPQTHFRKLQIVQNKCLRMILSAPFFTRTSFLHEELKIPMIRDFVDKITKNFYDRSKQHENTLISTLGDYKLDNLPFRLKHRLPKTV